MDLQTWKKLAVTFKGYSNGKTISVPDQFSCVSADDYKMLECLTGLLSSPSSPPWLRSVCGTFLSKVLLREKGVQHVIEFMAGDIDGDTGQLDKIARVLMSKPKSVPTVPVSSLRVRE